MNKIDELNKKQLKNDLPEIRPGYTVKISQKIKEGDKQRTQVFEGLVIAIKHGKGANSMVTVRKISHNVGVERIFPLHLPSIEKIEVVKKGRVRRAKLYYIRKKSAKETRLKEIVGKKAAEEQPAKKESETE
jgi:large subunit ribosomal protein L19